MKFFKSEFQQHEKREHLWASLKEKNWRIDVNERKCEHKVWDAEK